MSIRQIRLNDKDQIRKQLPEFIGKSIHIVMVDGTAHVVKLQSIESNEIQVENMRLKKFAISFADISEVYFDINA